MAARFGAIKKSLANARGSDQRREREEWLPEKTPHQPVNDLVCRFALQRGVIVLPLIA
jgi:hypothetical protein